MGLITIALKKRMVPSIATLGSVSYDHSEFNAKCLKAIWPSYPWILCVANYFSTVPASVEQLPVTCAAQPSVIKTTCSELDLETWRLLNAWYNWIYSHIFWIQCKPS